MTTPICNYNCRYCGGSLHGMPDKVSYDVDELKSVIARDPDSVVCFYGGEPLLELETIRTFMDKLPARHFVLQTNGSLLKDLGEDVHRLDSILLSIDGIKKITDWYRRPGCYEKILEDVKWLGDKDFSGELIGRMTVSDHTDIFRDVRHLLEVGFPLVHWQLDVIWSNIWELDGFLRWSEESYKPGLHRLVEWWAKTIEETGSIPGIIPFRGIMSRLLFPDDDRLPHLPCGAGESAFAITTDGLVMGCPICPDFIWNDLGDIKKGFHGVDIGKPCTSCDLYGVCGGRCLFAYKEMLWGREGFDAVCGVTRFLVEELRAYEDICRPLADQMFYPPYNNSTEIIP